MFGIFGNVKKLINLFVGNCKRVEYIYVDYIYFFLVGNFNVGYSYVFFYVRIIFVFLQNIFLIFSWKGLIVLYSKFNFIFKV